MHWHREWDYEIRKITRVGNSFFIALPPRYLERLKLKKGDRVKVRTPYNEKAQKFKGLLTIEPYRGYNAK